MDLSGLSLVTSCGSDPLEMTFTPDPLAPEAATDGTIGSGTKLAAASATGGISWPLPSVTRMRECIRCFPSSLTQVARLQHRLMNELDIHRKAESALLRVQRLAIVQASLPKLLRLLCYTDDSRAQLDMPPVQGKNATLMLLVATEVVHISLVLWLSGFSVIARGPAPDGSSRPFIRRRHRSTSSELCYRESELTSVNYGTSIMRLGGPASPKTK